MVEEYQDALQAVLPFRKDEAAFLTALEEHGKLFPELISDNKDFCHAVVVHPSLLRRVRKVTGG